MTAVPTQAIDRPVHKTITVHASPELAFQVFTADFDSWWPRTHHIGKSPMTRGILECRPGGRCYNEQEDGTDSDWGRVLVWEPPTRFVLAWLIDCQDWKYQPDADKASEVEVRFTLQPDGSTRVDLEHRYFHRQGPAFDKMRDSVDSEGGWMGLLQLFAARAEQVAQQAG